MSTLRIPIVFVSKKALLQAHSTRQYCNKFLALHSPPLPSLTSFFNNSPLLISLLYHQPKRSIHRYFVSCNLDRHMDWNSWLRKNRKRWLLLFHIVFFFSFPFSFVFMFCFCWNFHRVCILFVLFFVICFFGVVKINEINISNMMWTIITELKYKNLIVVIFTAPIRNE